MKISYFAKIREMIGRDQDEIDVPSHALSVDDIVSYLITLDTIYAHAFADKSKLRFALDNELVGPQSPVEDADELAIFPPVTGG